MRFYICLLLILICLTSCFKYKNDPPPKQPDELPPVTQEGKWTFGFLLNGEVWRAKTTLLFSPAFGAHYDNGILRLDANRKTGDIYQTININVKIDKAGNYNIDPWIGLYSKTGAIFSDERTNCDYFSDSTNAGKINILKFDTLSGIIAGTFEMKLHSDSCGSINITEGRFDLKRTP